MVAADHLLVLVEARIEMNFDYTRPSKFTHRRQLLDEFEDFSG